MSDLKRKYEELKNQREKTIEELNQLREDDRVKRYIELQSKNETLYNEQIALYVIFKWYFNEYQELKKEEYSSCNHILVYSEIDYDRYEGRSYKRCGCIKCGLDGSVSSQSREYLPFSQKIMYDYLRKNHLRGKETNIACDLDLAHAIYSKVKEVHPDIDDDTAIGYFEIALNNIRNTKVSEDRKTNRAKRLSLGSKFKNWNASDVHHG